MLKYHEKNTWCFFLFTILINTKSDFQREELGLNFFFKRIKFRICSFPSK